jgi:cell shape-determining protein MreC
MRRRSADSPSLRGPVACCLLAVVALSLGPSAESAVRSAVRDAVRPGYLLANRLSAATDRFDIRRWPWTTSLPREHDAVGQATEPLDTADVLELRRLRAELADAKRALAAFDASLGPVRAGGSAGATHGVERIAARVLDAQPGTAAGGLILAAGTAHGAAPGRPVVAPLTLAAGEGDGVRAGATVLAGAAVLGRTDEVGAITATVLPVTAPEFRAHVWIVRAAEGGPTFGDDGVLEGDGRGGCVVKYVPSTAAVAVGDHVYSRDPTGRLPQPLYYGRVDRVQLRDGAPHWDIHVHPAGDVSRHGVVHVLRLGEPEPLQASTR